MKRNKLVSIAAITVALGVLATGCAGGSGSSKSDSKSSGGTKTVTVKAGTGANVKPYTYVGDDNETTGYDVEVLKEVFDRLDGYDLQIEVTDIPSVFSGVTSGTYQIGVNNFSYNEERAKSYLYSYPYDKIGYVFITKKGAPEVKTFADAAGKSFEGQSGVSVTTAIENWNEKNPDKKIDITYTDADTAITLQHIEDGTTDLAIIDVAMYNAYQKEYNYDIVANQISDDDLQKLSTRLRSTGFEILEDSTKKQIEKIKNLIIQKISEEDIEEYFVLSDFLSSGLNKDYSAISKLFSQNENLTLEQYWILQKMEKVKELLLYKEFNLTEISLKLGYKSVQHLSNQFKKMTGFSPTQFVHSKEKRIALDKV